MRKALCALYLALALSASALEVEVEELKSAQGEIIFINYTGKEERIDSAEEIKAVGFFLARGLEGGGARSSFLMKYTIIRAVDPSVEEKLDADIFSIDKEARVDHIDNVRRIIAGYLEGAWGYSAQEAGLLAFFATIYNAVHRGDMDYFSGTYKPIVLSYLDRANAGLSTRYDEWPGATRLLIPLASGARRGAAGTVSTTALTEEKVIEELRKREDKGLEERKDMVELKEREVEQKKAAAGEEAGGLKAEGERISAAEKALAEEKARLESKGEATPEERRTVEEREKKLEAEKAALAAEEAKAAKAEEEIRRKEEEIRKEKAGVIAEEKARLGEAMAAAGKEAAKPGPALFTDKLYYLKTRKPLAAGSRSGGHITGTLSLIDPVPDRITTTSPVEHIAGRSFYFFKERILVIGHGGDEASPAFLLLLDPRSLEPAVRSAEEVYADSFLALQGGSIYAVLEGSPSHRLGMFDEDLKLVASSPLPVDRDSAIALFGEKLYVNSPQAGILVLERRTLKQLGEVK